jgi:hypothetical protein
MSGKGEEQNNIFTRLRAKLHIEPRPMPITDFNKSISKIRELTLNFMEK